MQIVDSHCHINFEELAKRLPEILSNARLNDVTHMLCVSVNLEDFPQVKALADEYDHIFASVGVHPCYKEVKDPSTEELIEIGSDPNIVAIGETGLDYSKCRRRHHAHAKRRGRRSMSWCNALLC